ncbi:MAG: EAL domain-containing protein [Erysipelotrichales bacterium]|nr:EAL domain-containing protein [Erysipelotrichales bacterium]
MIIKVASLLGFSILAEGIETKEQVDLLKKTSCQERQGYYYFRPSNCEVIKKLLQEKK